MKIMKERFQNKIWIVLFLKNKIICQLKAFTFYFLLFTFNFAFSSCKDKLPIEDDISSAHLAFLTQDSAKVIFPDYLKGKVVVMGFIFTNCPDICPLTTNNMQRIQKELETENINDVSFVSLSFDPERDRPWVLKQYAAIRGIELNNWTFLTGQQATIDSLKRKTHFMAIPGDTSYTPEGKPYYFFVHTDRISLIDQQGRVRKNYKGSRVEVKEVVEDVKELR